MASSDIELIDEARVLTYGSDVISDSDFQTLVNVAKEEMYSELDDTEFSFYGSDTHNADRALFWLVCLFAKVHTGEIGGINMTVGDLRAAQLAGTEDLWKSNFFRRLQSSDDSIGFGSTTISRTDREYSYE